MKPMTHDSALTADLDLNKAYKIPIAHAEGRFHAEKKTLPDLVENDQILFKYCTEKGEITEGGNPNGTTLNIAGICNAQRNVFGMMPHPERASETELGNIDGRFMFDSLISHALVC